MCAANAVRRDRSHAALRLRAAVSSAIACDERCRVEPLESRVLFAVGDLDPLFSGGSGAVTLDHLNRNNFGGAVAVQSDNKVLVAGFVATGTSTGNDLTVARFNADGSLDTTFGAGGIVVTDLGSTLDNATGIAIQADGKIVVGAQARGAAGNTIDFAVVRYNADGTLDAGFGTAGKTVTDLGANAHDRASAITLTADGRIVLVGSTTVGGFAQFAAARYTSAGQLDGTFGGGDGIVVESFSGGTAEAKAALALANGSLVIAGTLTDFGGFGSDFAAVRLLSDGSLDAGFGSAGWATVDLGGESDIANAVAVLGDGRMLLAGESGDGTQQDVGLARLTSDGQLDDTFADGAGFVLKDFAGGIDWGSAMRVQSDGRIVVAGSATVDGLSQFAVARFLADGTPDDSFGTGGATMIPFAGESFGKALALDGQGRVVVAGNTVNAGGGFDLAVARLEGDPLNQPPIGDAGSAYTVVAGSSVQLSAAGSVDVDGSIVSYEWDFDYDGSTFDVNGSGATPTFSAAGIIGPSVRTIALRVTDNHGTTHVVTTTVTITAKPTPPAPPPPAPGTAVLVDDPANPGKKMLLVTGTTKSETIRIKNGKKGAVEVRLGGNKLGTFSGATRVVVNGGNGNDVIDASGLNVPVALFGGAGNDLLVGGDVSDILSGGDGNDHLFGGRGNDLLVGGAGKDDLHSWRGNDVLVGGSLAVENDLASMHALLSEWTRTDRTLSQRISNLLDGGGKNGSTKLTALDDNARDTLVGSVNTDWLVTGGGDRVMRLR